jgi:predicted Zn-dependent peptidase
MSEITHHALTAASGHRVGIAHMPFAECVSLSIYLPVGSRHETPKVNEGIAHFIEHMVFKGTGRRDARAISLDAESAGGQLNAFTSEDHTAYEARGPAELLPLLAEILTDLVWNPTFPQEEIDREREVIIEEILMYYESPSDHISDLASRAMWGLHPLGHPITGSEEILASIGRNELVAFANTFYHSPQAVIAVAGPLPPAAVLAILEPLLPTPSSSAIVRPTPFDLARFAPNTLVESRDTEQTQLSVGFHTPGRASEERHALRLLSLILGEPMSSRLFQELREKRGLCYQISSDVSLFEDTGAFDIGLGTDPDSRDECLDLIQAEITRMTADGPTAAEVAAAKRYASGQSRLAFESTASHMAWVGESLLFHDRLIPVPEARARLDAVTATEVQHACSTHLTPARRALAEISPE